MNTKHYHTPITDSQRKRCPICEKPVYSPAGIHPQCAIKQNEGVVPMPHLQGEPQLAAAVAPAADPKRKPRPV